MATNETIERNSRRPSPFLFTFFSTFPRFGLKLTDGTLVSKAIRDTLWERPDTLASFRKAVLVINPIDYLKQQKITLHRLALDSAKIYAYKHEDGRTNWDILPTDTTAVTPKDTSRTDTARLIREIDIRRVVLRHASLTFDDRETPPACAPTSNWPVPPVP